MDFIEFLECIYKLDLHFEKIKRIYQMSQYPYAQIKRWFGAKEDNSPN